MNCTPIWLYFRISFLSHLNRITPKTKWLRLNGVWICFSCVFQVYPETFRPALYIFSLQNPATTRFTVRRFTHGVYLSVPFNCDNKLRIFVCTAHVVCSFYSKQTIYPAKLEVELYIKYRYIFVFKWLITENIFQSQLWCLDKICVLGSSAVYICNNKT